MAFADDARLSQWREVLGLCRVRQGEDVVVLTSESSHALNVDMAVRTASFLGARTMRIDLPPLAGGAFGQRADVAVTPLTGQRLAVEAMKQADMVIDLMGVLHSPEQLEILDARTRMLMVIEPPDMLGRLMPNADDKRRVKAAEARLERARRMDVSSDAGTDLRMQLGQFRVAPQWGFSDEPGHWDHWPSAFVSTWPNERSAEGRVVIDVGDMLFPFKSYVQSRIVLEIRSGAIVRIEGGFDAKYLRRHLESYCDRDAFGVSHVGWGLHRTASWGALGLRDKIHSHGMDARSFMGNFLFSTGPNAEAGGSNCSACHVDIPMSDCSVSLDGEPVTVKGEVVAPDQRVAA